jgi:ATP synthase F1 delta subunit
MSSQTEIYTYAMALHAFSTDNYEMVQLFFDSITEGLHSQPDLYSFLQNPQYGTKEKKAVLCSAATQKLPGEIDSIVAELIVKGKTLFIPGISDNLRAIHQMRTDVQPVTIISAIELPKKQKETLEKKIVAVLGKTIIVEWKVNHALIAGFQIQIGNQYLDTSVQQMLDDTATYLLENIRG